MSESRMEKHETQCREFLASRWSFADVHPQYPASTGVVLQLMQGLQYVVDLPTISSYIEGGKLLPPQMRAGHRVWLAADIVDLMGLLEEERKWAAFSTLHRAKKSRWEIHQELAAIGQAPDVFNDLEHFSLDELLRYLVEVDQREVRELLYTAIKIKMK